MLDGESIRLKFVFIDGQYEKSLASKLGYNDIKMRAKEFLLLSSPIEFFH